jgi:hypothetical protein
MPRWLERLLVIYLVSRTLSGVALFALVAFLIIRG